MRQLADPLRFDFPEWLESQSTGGLPPHRSPEYFGSRAAPGLNRDSSARCFEGTTLPNA
jgi:hypothetical protein